MSIDARRLGRFFTARMHWLSAVLLLVGATFVGKPLMADEPAVVEDGPVLRFLSQYCWNCHNDKTAEAGRNFRPYRLPLKTQQQLITTDEIISQVTLHHMPPEDAEQPTDDERLQLIEALRQAVSAARESLQSTGGRTVLRRLSNREYENTLASLFGRRVDTLGLTANFPKDNTSRHFDNIGRDLVTSGFLLDQYLQAAERFVELRLAKPNMQPRSWRFRDHFVQYEELSGSHRSVFQYEYLCLYEQPNTDTRQGGYGHIEDFLEGVPVSGCTTSKSMLRPCIAIRITIRRSSESTSPSRFGWESFRATREKATFIIRRRSNPS